MEKKVGKEGNNPPGPQQDEDRARAQLKCAKKQLVFQLKCPQLRPTFETLLNDAIVSLSFELPLGPHS